MMLKMMVMGLMLELIKRAQHLNKPRLDTSGLLTNLSNRFKIIPILYRMGIVQIFFKASF